jgi:hypothetical protein
LENPSWLTGRKQPTTCYRGSAHGRKLAHGAEAAHALGGDTSAVTTRPGRAVARSSPARGWPWWLAARERPSGVTRCTGQRGGGHGEALGRQGDGDGGGLTGSEVVPTEESLFVDFRCPNKLNQNMVLKDSN